MSAGRHDDYNTAWICVQARLSAHICTTTPTIRAQIAAQPATTKAREKPYCLVNCRVNHHLSTVKMSNCTEREAAQVHGRIKAAVHVHISAPDARGMIKTGR